MLMHETIRITNMCHFHTQCVVQKYVNKVDKANSMCIHTTGRHTLTMTLVALVLK